MSFGGHVQRLECHGSKLVIRGTISLNHNYKGKDKNSSQVKPSFQHRISRGDTSRPGWIEGESGSEVSPLQTAKGERIAAVYWRLLLFAASSACSRN